MNLAAVVLVRQGNSDSQKKGLWKSLTDTVIAASFPMKDYSRNSFFLKDVNEVCRLKINKNIILIVNISTS